MQRTVHKGALLAGAIAIVLAVPISAFARPHPRQKARTLAHKLAHKPKIKHAMVAVTYTGEVSKQPSVANSRFWIDGGGVNGAATFYRGLGAAADLSVIHGRVASSDTTIGKTTIAFGPRYTKNITEWTRKGRWMKKEDWFKKAPPSQIYGEVLFGVAHGFDGAFPDGNSINASANSFALQLGAGLDITLWHHLGARVFELDYIRTNLPNGAANNQNDLRLSFGINYRFDAPAVPPVAAEKIDAGRKWTDADGDTVWP